jgi:hypothetical protein
MKIRTLLPSDVTFTIECLPEDLSIEGNVMASGDDAFDLECEEKIRKDLDSGNEWAWCCVRVTAEWEAPNGQTFKGVEHLGGVSCESEKDFTEGQSDYFEDLKAGALEDLNDSIRKLAEALPKEKGAWLE